MSSKPARPRRANTADREPKPQTSWSKSRFLHTPLSFSVGAVLLFMIALWWATGFRPSPGHANAQPPTTLSASAVKSTEPISSNPGELPGESFGTQVNRGNQLLKEGKPEAAVQVLTEAMQLKPNDEDVHYNLGLALTKLGRLPQAIEQYEQALRIFPNYAEAHNNLGNLLMRIGRTEEAIAHFESALKLMPDYASAHNNLGTALQRTDHPHEANTHFESAVRIDPEYWQARYNLAMSRQQAGKLDQAHRELLEVLRLRPDFEPARLALNQIEARQSLPSP